eukprot:RCo045195
MSAPSRATVTQERSRPFFFICPLALAFRRRKGGKGPWERAESRDQRHLGRRERKWCNTQKISSEARNRAQYRNHSSSHPPRTKEPNNKKERQKIYTKSDPKAAAAKSVKRGKGERSSTGWGGVGGQGAECYQNENGESLRPRVNEPLAGAGFLGGGGGAPRTAVPEESVGTGC